MLCIIKKLRFRSSFQPSLFVIPSFDVRKKLKFPRARHEKKPTLKAPGKKLINSLRTQKRQFSTLKNLWVMEAYVTNEVGAVGEGESATFLQSRNLFRNLILIFYSSFSSSRFESNREKRNFCKLIFFFWGPVTCLPTNTGGGGGESFSCMSA